MLSNWASRHFFDLMEVFFFFVDAFMEPSHHSQKFGRIEYILLTIDSYFYIPMHTFFESFDSGR